jgi:hypothetical protein
MRHLFLPSSPIRIFTVSAIITAASLIGTGVSLGLSAAIITAILIIIEITFSFDNAIVNARVLMTMSSFWQRMFMTIGVFIAVFGMRLVFPILIVMATSGLGWGEVISLALHRPDLYALQLARAHGAIASFGGMFLVMLCLHFFFDRSRTISWLSIIERPLQRVGHWWLGALICLVILGGILQFPLHGDTVTVAIAGIIGILTYLALHGVAELFIRRHQAAEQAAGGAIIKTGLAGLTAFLYLEILDASFSFDGVIGAFAITQDVVLIAIGLGVGALWVRSLTLFMVRKNVLSEYRYLEHGAHYTIGILAFVLLSGLFFDVPEAVPGLAGIIVIGLAILSSLRISAREQSLR